MRHAARAVHQLAVAQQLRLRLCGGVSWRVQVHCCAMPNGTARCACNGVDAPRSRHARLCPSCGAALAVQQCANFMISSRCCKEFLSCPLQVLQPAVMASALGVVVVGADAASVGTHPSESL